MKRLEQAEPYLTAGILEVTNNIQHMPAHDLGNLEQH